MKELATVLAFFEIKKKRIISFIVSTVEKIWFSEAEYGKTSSFSISNA